MDNANKRIKWIDYLKAFACLLVAIGHLLMSLDSIDHYTNITSFVIWFIYLFHMPLFMCMSGILYLKKAREFSWKAYKEFELKKIINFIIPYLTFYSLFMILNITFASSVNTPRGFNEWIGMINNPIAPYWFLYALLSIFLVIPLVEKIFKNNKKIIFCLFIILKILSVFYNPKLYFIKSIMEHGLYFYLGIFFIEERKKMKTKNKIISCILYFLVALGIYQFKEIIYDKIMNLISIIFAVMGIWISIKIFEYINKSIILDTFKNYTFQIYLTHTIFAAGVRVTLFKLGINDYWIHFSIGLLASIYMPVIMSKISEKIKYTDFFFYPLKTIGKLKRRNQKEVL